MTTSTIKRSAMTLFSGPLDANSHRVRMVISAKGVTTDNIDVDPKNPSQDLIDLNPMGNIPTLLDRDLVLYQANIIMEYLDERFPHPPLLPVYPVARAKSRMMIYRMENDLYILADKIFRKQDEEQARKELRTRLLSLAPVFADSKYFLSDEFSLVDCTIAPLLWRLPLLEIQLPTQAKPIKEYCQRIFDTDFFQASLTEAERELGDKHDF